MKCPNCKSELKKTLNKNELECVGCNSVFKTKEIEGKNLGCGSGKGNIFVGAYNKIELDNLLNKEKFCKVCSCGNMFKVENASPRDSFTLRYYKCPNCSITKKSYELIIEQTKDVVRYDEQCNNCVLFVNNSCVALSAKPCQNCWAYADKKEAQNRLKDMKKYQIPGYNHAITKEFEKIVNSII